MARRLDKEAVLRELDRLAQGGPPEQQTPVERFLQCPDWQKASEIFARALDASLRNGDRRGNMISPPPGWLPPMS